MKKQIFLLINVIFYISGFCQDLELTWQRCFGGSMIDVAYDVVIVENGYIIAGGTGSNDGDISYSYGNGDGWLVRIDSLGNILWEKTYGGSDSESFFGIIPTLNNNFYLLGLSWSSDGNISNDPYPDSPDYWIVKIDADGNIIWDKIVGGNAGEELLSGSPTADGGVVAIGETSSNDGDISEFYGGNDAWIVKLSSTGELEWDFTIGTNFYDVGQVVIQTSDGGYLIGSSSIKGDGGNISCEPISNGYSDGVLFKLDADRNIEWQQCYGSTNHDAMWELMELTDGYLFIEGVTANDGNVSGWHGVGDIWVVKIDFFGNIVWQKCLGGSLWESAKNSYKTDDDDFIIIGSTQSNDGDVTGNHSMSDYDYDIWLVKLSGDGELISQQCFGGAGSEIINFGVVKKSDNNFVIAGQTDYGPSYDVGCAPHGSLGIDTDYWVFEIEDTSTNVINPTIGESEFRVYPNPAGDYAVFEVQGSEFGDRSNEIQIFDVFGREVLSKQVVEEKTYPPSASLWRTTFDLRGLMSGIYFYRVEIEGEMYGGKLVIQ